MTEAQKRLLERYFTSHLGDGWQAGPFSHLDGWAAVDAIWPLNDLFRPHWALITSLPYVPRLEKAADAALERLVFGGTWTASDPPANVWRVLLERHVQAQQVALANHAQGRAQCVPIPAALPREAWQGAVVLFLHYAMKLPFPIADRSRGAWPEAFQPGSLQRH